MADGHFPDVELLRRELAALILEWAGQAVKDDPDGPMSTALTRAVSEAARSAVAEQHQILAADTADRIAEALERRSTVGRLGLWRAPPWGLGLIAVTVTALLVIAFLLGLQSGRVSEAVPAASAETAVTAPPIAPLAPAADEPQPTSSTPRVATPQPPASSPRPERAERAPSKAAKPASRPPPREVGRPAPASDETSPRSTQPVGAPTPNPAGPTPGTMR
ncbi:hypothetical protein [Caulobacter sp. DWR1-3-2b1]|uniref:hypothetical protein n=1 Tax=Caulobacter sp. DWR1-3-2b1 TaxID=2804670 RepID=UPI003CF2BE3D